MLPPILQIDDILVSTDIISEYFCCDYATCRGVCCIEGDSGAPMEDHETAMLRDTYSQYAPLMSDEGRETVAAQGYSVIDMDGDLVTPLIGSTEECAYCHRHPEMGFMCAIERAGCAKPISCSLYPIRVATLSNGMKALNLHRWKICGCAFEKGKKEGIRVYEFLHNPIVRAFGEEFYEALETAARELLPE